MAFIDQGYTGGEPATQAAAYEVQLEAVKLSQTNERAPEWCSGSLDTGVGIGGKAARLPDLDLAVGVLGSIFTK